MAGSDFTACGLRRFQFLPDSTAGSAEKGHLKVVQALLDKGADVNAKDRDGWTALIQATYKGHLEIVQALLDKGADVNVKSKSGLTVMTIAVRSGQQEVADFLRQAGAKE